MRRVFTTIAIAAVVLCLRAEAFAVCSSRVGNYCCLHDGLPGVKTIKVKLNNDLANLCDGPNQTCSSKYDVQREIMDALAEVYNASGSQLRFEFHSWVSSSSPDAITGYLHVRSKSQCTSPGEALSDPGFYVFGSWYGSGTVKLCESIQSGTSVLEVPWAAANTRGGHESLRGVFLHELGHVLGMDHPGDAGCPDQTNSFYGIMTSGGSGVYPAQNIMRGYMKFMDDVYGLRTNVPKMFYSTDGNTYYDVSSNIPSSVGNTLTRYAASNSVAGNTMWTAWRSNLGTLTNRVVTAFYSGSTWTVIELLMMQYAKYHVGIATKNGGSAAVSSQVHWNPYLEPGFVVVPNTEVKTTSTTNYGSTWTTPVAISNANEPINPPGVSMTYDPATAQYISLYRLSEFDLNENNPGALPEADRNVIAYRLHGAASASKLAGFNAIDTPSMACGPTSVVGTYNCLLAFTSDEDWGGGAHWKKCRVLNGSLDCVAGGVSSVYQLWHSVGDIHRKHNVPLEHCAEPGRSNHLFMAKDGVIF